MWLQWCWQVQALLKSRLNDRFAKSRRAGTLHEEGEAHGMNVQAGQEGRSHPSVTFRGVLDAPPHMVADVLGGRLRAQHRPAMRHVRAKFMSRMRSGRP